MDDCGKVAQKYRTEYQRAALKFKSEKSGNVLFAPANMQMVPTQNNTSSHYVLFGLHLLRNTHKDIYMSNTFRSRKHNQRTHLESLEA